MVAAAIAGLLNCHFLSSQADILGSTRRFQCLPKKRQHVRKAGIGRITAKFELMTPPYSMNALEPHMSHDMFQYHWGKHHRAYVDNLNKQIVGTELDRMTLEEIILATYNKGDLLPQFNNAAQVWNHDFFWASMKPGGGGEPSGELLELIKRDYGSFEGFVKEFKAAAATQFGSGWAWLACLLYCLLDKENKLDVGNAVNPCPSDEDKKLVIVKSPNAVNPLVWDYYPLLTIDVWEHAYYLDFQNRRPEYILIFMEKLVSWDAVSSRLEAAKTIAAESEREEERKNAREDPEDPEDNLAGNEQVEMYLDSDSDNSESE